MPILRLAWKSLLNRRLTASPEIAAPPDPTTVSALQDKKLLAD